MKAKQTLEKLLEDFESGWIANPSHKAECNRKKHTEAVRKILSHIERNEIISNILGESL